MPHLLRRDTLALSGALFSFVLVLACAPSPLPPPSVPRPDDSQLARCKVSASQDRPFVIEWPATERSRLESRTGAGLVVVNYSGCDMRVLDRCHIQGSYRFVRTTTAADGFTVTTGDELYARLPLGAVSLEGELERTGQLALRYAVVGQFESPGFDPTVASLVGECNGATHVVSGYAVGAFDLSSGTGTASGGGAGVLGVGAGVRHQESSNVIRSGGNLDSCQAAPGEGEVPAECGTPIQLFLAALPGAKHVAPGVADDVSASLDRRPPRANAGQKVAANDTPRNEPNATRVLAYVGAGIAAGVSYGLPHPAVDDRTVQFDMGVGPAFSGALGLRHRLVTDLETQFRGFLALGFLPGGSAKTDDSTVLSLDAKSLMLISPGIELTFRYRPEMSPYYLGLGGDGSLTISRAKIEDASSGISSETSSTRVLVHGLLETGLILGQDEQWDLGLRGGVGSTITFSNPALFTVGLAVGRTFD